MSDSVRWAAGPPGPDVASGHTPRAAGSDRVAVLIVDDDDLVRNAREIARRAWLPRGSGVLRPPRGALEVLKHSRFALFDVNMPGMSGVKLVRHGLRPP